MSVAERGGASCCCCSTIRGGVVLLKTCSLRDGCGETEWESDWEFCPCWSLLSLKNNRVGSAGEDIYRNNEWNTQGR